MADKISIETGVDKLVSLVSAKKKISMKDAAKELGASLSSVEEWAAFLEEEGIITIEYKFTTPYLISKAFSEKDIESKIKDFHAEKENMVRKAESEIAYLDHESDVLDVLKKNFAELKSSFGSEFDKAKAEIAKLEQYSKMKTQLAEEIQKQKTDFDKNIKLMNSELSKDELAYKDILLGMDRKNAEGTKIITEEKSMEKKFLEIEKELKEEHARLDRAENDLSQFSKKADEIRKDIDKKKNSLDEYKKESDNYIVKLEEKQKSMIAMVKEYEKTIADASKKGTDISTKFTDLLSKKEKAEKIILNLEKEQASLRKSFDELIIKMKAFETAAKKQNVAQSISEIHDKFNELEKKKSDFKKDIDELYSLFKK